jgi:hypothetical protein
VKEKMLRIFAMSLLIVASCTFIGMAFDPAGTVHVLRSINPSVFGIIGFLSVAAALLLFGAEWDDRREERAKERQKSLFG